MASTGGTAATANFVGEAERLHLGRLWRSRMLPSTRPDKLLGTLALLHRWGVTPAGAYAVAAVRYPQRTAIIDDHGPLTFGEVDRRTNALARAFRAAGVGEQDAVAIMCRNHRGFIEATVACSKLGANVVYLDTGLTAPRIAEVLQRAGPIALVHDAEFGALTPDMHPSCTRFIAWGHTSGRPSPAPFQELLAHGDESELEPPGTGRCATVLTTAITGSARVPEHTVPSSLLWPAPLRTRIPFRRGGKTVIAAPLSHPWGFLHLKLGMRLGSTLVLRRRFNPVGTLQDIAEHHVSALVLLPDMLREIMGTGPYALRQCRPGALDVIAVNGRTLPEDVALPAMQTFGEVLYNLSGPTMVKLSGRWVSVEDDLARRHMRRRRLPASLIGERARRRHA
jgi:acyl-CoA synthetase (AMP-forming)/AMP-acid ligase II